MSAADEARTITRCPHCRRSFRVPVAGLGRRATCPGCAQVFVVSPLEASADRAPDAPVAEERPTPRSGEAAACVVCQSPLGEQEPRTACPECGTLYHTECWEYNRGCGMYGCPAAPPTEKLQSLEIPAAHWGREDKACPACGRIILAAAVRCRHCGAVFSSAAPQETAAYRAQRAQTEKAAGVHHASIWLLVAALIPCTAPLAAVVAVPWYLVHRAAIARQRGVARALPLLAVGVALLQTIIFVAVAALYAAING